MASGYSRRNFLQFSGTALGALLLHPRLYLLPPPDETGLLPVAKGRVTTKAIYEYQEPSFQAQRLGYCLRDEVLDIFDILKTPDGPAHNPRWYQLANGYVYSAYIQRVENAHLNFPPLQDTPDGGQLGEITVPYTRSYRKIRTRWEPLYRLYYRSVYWITAIVKGPDGKTWYELTDDRLGVRYHVPASHVRPIPPEEILPIATSIPPDDKRIEVSIQAQLLTAYEGQRPVLQTPISSGVHTPEPTPNGLPSDTPVGRFRVQTKMPSRHMGDGELTDDVEAYELLGVPWVCFFHKDGYGFHGTYWHNNFGRKMSHGCVNMQNDAAQWLYRWTMPLITPADWYRRELGTLVIIT